MSRNALLIENNTKITNYMVMLQNAIELLN